MGENGHIVDLYSYALDQTGLHEMKYLCNFTGWEGSRRSLLFDVVRAGVGGFVVGIW